MTTPNSARQRKPPIVTRLVFLGQLRLSRHRLFSNHCRNADYNSKHPLEQHCPAFRCVWRRREEEKGGGRHKRKPKQKYTVLFPGVGGRVLSAQTARAFDDHDRMGTQSGAPFVPCHCPRWLHVSTVARDSSVTVSGRRVQKQEPATNVPIHRLQPVLQRPIVSLSLSLSLSLPSGEVLRTTSTTTRYSEKSMGPWTQHIK